jgi:type IV pilus assembly protein PilA
MVVMKCRPRPHRSAEAGFTLIELLLIVAIVGVLSALAVVGYRYWLKSARTGETKDLVQALMYGQHAYHADNDGYLDCSSSWTDFYPIAAGPDNTKHAFHNPSHGDYKCWMLLAADAESAGYASFTVRAGAPGDVPPQPPFGTLQNWPPTTWSGAWYIVLATLDQDADTTRGYLVGSAFQPDSIIGHNEEE